MRMLERDEADQRFRLEQINREMTEARGYIARARNARQNSTSGFEPGDESVEEDTRVSEAVEDWDLRQLFLQRAVLQTRKSMQEVEGVAFTFDHIRLQLINNRIDAEDRKKRLEEDVAEPLKRIASESMPTLELALKEADEVLRSLADPAKSDNATSGLEKVALAEERTLLALAEADSVLAEIQDVLNSLLKFETQNELLDLVRNLLEEQQALQKRTDAIRNQEAFDDIFEK